jgi:hypothetical protein
VANMTRKLRRELFWYSFGLACVVAVSGGVFLVIQDHSMTRGTVMSTLGLSLIGSVLFAVIFALLNNWVQERNVEETINEGVADLFDRFVRNQQQTDRLFAPQKTYPPINPSASPLDYGHEYNRDVTEDLEESGFFAAHGPSARYLAARLQRAVRRPQQIKVAMVNPADHRAVARRASDRRSWASMRGRPIAEVEQELENELLMNVVSLFDCRQICPIEILFHVDTAVYRYVMFDQAVYVSWYHSPASTQMEMPESYRFPRESFIYSSLRMDLLRKFEMATEDRIVFDSSQTDEQLLTRLNRLYKRRKLTEADLTRWRAEETRLSKGFSDFLQDLYRQRANHDA